MCVWTILDHPKHWSKNTPPATIKLAFTAIRTIWKLECCAAFEMYHNLLGFEEVVGIVMFKGGVRIKVDQSTALGLRPLRFCVPVFI